MTRYLTEGCQVDVADINATREAALQAKTLRDLAHDVATLARMVMHMRRLIDENAQAIRDR